MTSRKIFSISMLSGILGAMFSALLFATISNSNAAVTTSGYYVCGIKTTGVLRMSPTSNKCKATEFRYFFASTVDQVDPTVLQNSTQNTETFDFYAPQFGRCPWSSLGTSVVSGVSWNSYSKYNPLDIRYTTLNSCQITINVP